MSKKMTLNNRVGFCNRDAYGTIEDQKLIKPILAKAIKLSIKEQDALGAEYVNLWSKKEKEGLNAEETEQLLKMKDLLLYCNIKFIYFQTIRQMRWIGKWGGTLWDGFMAAIYGIESELKISDKFGNKKKSGIVENGYLYGLTRYIPAKGGHLLGHARNYSQKSLNTYIENLSKCRTMERILGNYTEPDLSIYSQVQGVDKEMTIAETLEDKSPKDDLTITDNVLENIEKEKAWIEANYKGRERNIRLEVFQKQMCEKFNILAPAKAAKR